ncbi:MAG: VWA domain-containing protein [Bacteroidetes bacterium]|nr:MAG: VWA domain-containing protein [Bacteroidota bacterium]
MDFLRFENQEYFYLFLVIPVFLLVFILANLHRKKKLLRLGDTGIVDRMMPMHSVRRPWLKLVLFMLAFSSLVMAAVNPQLGYKTEDIKQTGVDIVVALDVSRSMLAEDIRPNRMERSKMAVGRLIDQLENDRVALVIFAGSAVTQVPLTSDREAAKMILRTVNTESIQIQGTAIGAALERSIASFSRSEAGSRVIILVSDGENHQDDPLPVVERAREQGIVIHSVGVGTSQGAPIPVYQNNQLSGFLRDAQGNTVISRFDEPMLRAIAEKGGGIFQAGTGADIGLNRIMQQIREMEQQEFETAHFSEYESRFHYFLALAIIFLVLEFLIFERKSKWLNRIKLFDVS